MLITYANIDNSIQVYIPLQKSSQSFVTKIKCQVNSNTTHDVLISKEVNWKNYKEICNGEPKKVNLGYNNDPKVSVVKNNTQLQQPQRGDHLYGELTAFSYDWEVLSKFFSIHNIKPNWLDCKMSWGYYDEDLGEWTGCMGKV